MKYFLTFSIALLSIFVAGCKEKFGVDKIVKIDRQLIASDDLYVKYLSDQIDRFPGQEDSYIKLADIYISQNKTEAAIELLSQANKQIPESLEILIHLGTLYLDQEDMPNLSNSLRRIRRINPDHMDFLKLSSGYEPSALAV